MATAVLDCRKASVSTYQIQKPQTLIDPSWASIHNRLSDHQTTIYNVYTAYLMYANAAHFTVMLLVSHYLVKLVSGQSPTPGTLTCLLGWYDPTDIPSHQDQICFEQSFS